jgi:pimeloyl-ACP methyl ester carboxylesterase
VSEPTPTSHSFDANGLRLVVHDWGGDGTPVLLAHPTGFHGRVFAPLASRLVARGHHVYSFDFRGHGDSDAPDVESETYSWDGFAGDVLAVTDHLALAGRDDLLACGHSKGGAALLLAAARAPGTYARIWTYEPVMLPGKPSPERQEVFAMAHTARRRNEWSSTDEAFAVYGSKPPLDAMSDESLRAYVGYGLRDRGDGVFELKCRPEVEARIYAMGMQHSAYDDLTHIDVPVRVVCGETSNDVSPAFGARIVDRLPQGSLEVMEGCGHFGPQQDPHATARSIVAFGATRV